MKGEQVSSIVVVAGVEKVVGTDVPAHRNENDVVLDADDEDVEEEYYFFPDLEDENVILKRHT